MAETYIDYFDEDGPLLKRIESLDRIGSTPMKAMILLEDPRINFTELIDRWVPSQYEGTSYEKEEYENYYIVKLDIVNRKKQDSLYECPTCGESISKDELIEHGLQSELLLVFSKNQDDSVFYLITNEGSTELEIDLGFFNSLYPFISRVGFRSKQLRKVLTEVSEDEEVKVKNYVAKRYYGEKTTIEEHPEDMSVQDAFQRARSEDTWIDSIACEVDGNRVRLSRSGPLHYYQDYRFSDFLDEILTPLLRETTEKYRKLLSDRSRDSESMDVKPLVFETENNVFSSEDEGSNLIKEINSIDSFEVARVNEDKSMPELMIKDYKSGASFNLDVISTDKMAINPQTQVTEISLYKLINKISERYDGEFIERSN